MFSRYLHYWGEKKRYSCLVVVLTHFVVDVDTVTSEKISVVQVDNENFLKHFILLSGIAA